MLSPAPIFHFPHPGNPFGNHNGSLYQRTSAVRGFASPIVFRTPIPNIKFKPNLPNHIIRKDKDADSSDCKMTTATEDTVTKSITLKNYYTQPASLFVVKSQTYFQVKPTATFQITYFNTSAPSPAFRNPNAPFRNPNAAASSVASNEILVPATATVLGNGNSNKNRKYLKRSARGRALNSLELAKCNVPEEVEIVEVDDEDCQMCCRDSKQAKCDESNSNPCRALVQYPYVDPHRTPPGPAYEYRAFISLLDGAVKDCNRKRCHRHMLQDEGGFENGTKIRRQASYAKRRFSL